MSDAIEKRLCSFSDFKDISVDEYRFFDNKNETISFFDLIFFDLSHILIDISWIIIKFSIFWVLYETYDYENVRFQWKRC